GGAQLCGGLRAPPRRIGGLSSRREEVNGQPGALLFDGEGRLIAVMILDVAEGQIQSVNSIVNPDKLRHLGPLAGWSALRREHSEILRSLRAQADCDPSDPMRVSQSPASSARV